MSLIKRRINWLGFTKLVRLIFNFSMKKPDCLGLVVVHARGTPALNQRDAIQRSCAS
jgi:hypothetical protein